MVEVYLFSGSVNYGRFTIADALAKADDLKLVEYNIQTLNKLASEWSTLCKLWAQRDQAPNGEIFKPNIIVKKFRNNFVLPL